MIIHGEEMDMNPADATLQPLESVTTREASDIGSLRALMEFYESDQIPDDEESEIDLMIQLSGMVYSDMRSDQ